MIRIPFLISAISTIYREYLRFSQTAKIHIIKDLLASFDDRVLSPLNETFFL